MGYNDKDGDKMFNVKITEQYGIRRRSGKIVIRERMYINDILDAERIWNCNLEGEKVEVVKSDCRPGFGAMVIKP